MKTWTKFIHFMIWGSVTVLTLELTWVILSEIKVETNLLVSTFFQSQFYISFKTSEDKKCHDMRSIVKIQIENDT